MLLNQLADTVYGILDEIFDFYNYKTINADDILSMAEDKNINMDWGATRFCFWHEDCPEVIKIINFVDTSYDYCADEIKRYTDACKYGIQKMLLPIRKYGVYERENITLYAQPCFHYDNTSKKDFEVLRFQQMDKSQAMYKFLTKHKNEILYQMHASQDNIQFLSGVYSLGAIHRFFIWAHKNNVQDLHRGNFALYKGKPVIIDYANYYPQYDLHNYAEDYENYSSNNDEE